MKKLHNLTKDMLTNLYINDKKSLGDIAAMYGVSRTAIYKKNKEYGIKQRSKSEARIEAQKQDKLPQQFIYAHKDSMALFNLLYNNAKNALYLERKHKRFLEGLDLSRTGL